MKSCERNKRISWMTCYARIVPKRWPAWTCPWRTHDTYLPYHPAFHPEKPDKVQDILDCSAEYRDTSRNKQLLQGLDLTNSLVGVLMRFRQEPVAFMSDIEAKFYQVWVQPSDCNYLQFLWWSVGNLEKKPEEYRMLVHLFSSTSSPSCTNNTLKKTADHNRADFDAATVETVKRNFCVDDCPCSIATDTKAVCLAGQLGELLSKRLFKRSNQLCSWARKSTLSQGSLNQQEFSTKWTSLRCPVECSSRHL